MRGATKKRLLCTVGVIVALTLTAILLNLFSSRLIRIGLEQFSPPLLGSKVTVSDVDVNWLRGRAVISDLTIANPPGFDEPTLCTIGRISLDLAMTSLFSDTIRIGEIEIQKPEVTYERKNGTDNLTAFQEAVDKLSGTPTAGEGNTNASSSTRLIIHSLSIADGTARVDLGELMSKPFILPIPTLTLTDLGDADGGITPGHVATKITDALMGGIATCLLVGGQSVDTALQNVSSNVSTVIDQADEALNDAVKNLETLFR